MSEQHSASPNVGLPQAIEDANTLLESYLQRTEKITPPLEVEKVAQDAIDRASLASKHLETKLTALNHWAAEMKLPAFSVTLIDGSKAGPGQLEPVIQHVILKGTGKTMEIKTKGQLPLEFRRINPAELSERTRADVLDQIIRMRERYSRTSDIKRQESVKLLQNGFQRNEDTSYWVLSSDTETDWSAPLAQEVLAALFDEAERKASQNSLDKSKIQRQLGITEALPAKIDEQITESILAWDQTIAKFETASG